MTSINQSINQSNNQSHHSIPFNPPITSHQTNPSITSITSSSSSSITYHPINPITSINQSTNHITSHHITSHLHHYVLCLPRSATKREECFASQAAEQPSVKEEEEEEETKNKQHKPHLGDGTTARRNGFWNS
jgi:hypothetical protein